jgi:hypothetical protein
MRAGTVKKTLDDTRVRAIAADNPMLAELPDVAKARCYLPFGFRESVLVSFSIELIQSQPNYFTRQKTCIFKIHAEVVTQTEHLSFENISVPARIFCKAVCGKHKRPALSLGEMTRQDAWHLLHVEANRGFNNGVTGNDHFVAVYKDWNDKPVLAQTSHEPPDLTLWVKSWIIHIGY